MSLVFQMISSGNSNLTANSAVASGGNVEEAAAIVPFAQALIQKMTVTADTGTVVTAATGDAISMLQGLIKEMQPLEVQEEDTNLQNVNLLDELAHDIEELDEAMVQDPALLGALQGWLIQVSTLLQGDKAVEVDSAENTEVLSPLAQNPDTLRFAVEDELNTLVTIIKDAAVSGDEELATKGLILLNQFTEIMKQSAVVSVDKPKVQMNQTQTVTDESVVKVTKFEVAPSAPVMVTAEAGKGDSELSGSLQSKPVVAAEIKKTVSEDAPTTSFTVPTDENEIVTIGQLSMRDGISAPLKAETPRVPVQQFATEMTGLVTSKLAIVSKGGVAEATISLFPENLGQVDVKITMQNGHLIAQFITENAGAKDLLEQQMVQLRSALQAQGLQVEKLEVTQNNTPLQSQMQQDGRQSDTSRQQSERRSKNQNGSEDAINVAELNGEWQDWIRNEEDEITEQGGSFSAKA